MLINRRTATLITVLLVLWLCATSQQLPRTKKRKHGQKMANLMDSNVDSSTLENKVEIDDTNRLLSTRSYQTFDTVATTSAGLIGSDQQCPICADSNPSTMMKRSLESFWNNNLHLSYACACTYLLRNGDNNILRSVISSIASSKFGYIISKKTDPPSADPPSVLHTWDVLGPINIGKLEVDAGRKFENILELNYLY